MKTELLTPKHEEREKYSEQEYDEILDECGAVDVEEEEEEEEEEK